MAAYAPVLKQRIFEARYEQGYRYLDRCGDALVILESLLTEQTSHLWLPHEANPSSARLKCPDLDITLLFSSLSMIVDQCPVEDVPLDFAQVATTTLATLTGRFDLRKFRRFGYRTVRVLPATSDSIEDAEKLSLNVPALAVWLKAPPSGFDQRSYEQTTVYELPDRSKGLRVSTKPFTKVGTDLQVDERLKAPPHHLPDGQRKALLEQLKRNKARQQDPEAGVSIDIDFYYMWPPKDLTVSAFLQEANATVDSALKQLLHRS
jgi:hypothetical protein